MKKLNPNGFTIVELMIASAVFSTVLVGCAAAMITVGRQLNKANISIATQNTARGIIEEVARQLQLSSQKPILDSGVVCVGKIRYSYALNTQVENTADPSKHQNRHGLWRDIIPNPDVCTRANLTVPTPGGGSQGQEMLPLHSRLAEFKVSNSGYADDRIWDVSVAVVYGDDDVIINPNTPPYDFNCQPSSLGGAFCALSQLYTTVFRRVL
jgi:prepilin-type N-terminal cleavage/methylation domain-containing protein